MPSKSIAQQHLMQAAEHGADFPMAKKLRASMSHSQLHDFSVGSEKGKPEHAASDKREQMKDPPPTGPVSMAKSPLAPASPKAPYGAPPGMPEAVSVSPKVPMVKGSTSDIMASNMSSLKNAGMNELEATKASLRGAGKSGHPHKNLGSWLHPRKG
jgi:hypothetical protein